MSNETEQRTPEWFEARKGRLTASSVGAVLGNSPYATRDDVMRRMVREWHGAPNEFTGNIATQYGERNEAGALMEYQLETGNAVEQVGFLAIEDWAGCSPDGLIGLIGGLEIKCPFGKRKMGPGDSFKTLDEQPHYHDQIQFSLWVTQRAWWDFYQWAPPAPGFINTNLVRVTPCSKWRAKNLPKLRQFYAEYLHERESNFEAHLEPLRVVIDTPEAARMIREWDELCDAIQQAEDRKKDLLDQITALTNGRDADFAGRRVTQVERAGSVSYAKVVKEHLPKLDLEPYRGKPSRYWKVG